MSIQTFLLPFSHASKNLTEALFYCNLIHLIPLLKWPSWLFEAISTFLKVQVKAFWDILKLFGCTHTGSEHIMCLFQAWILNTRFTYWTFFPEQSTHFSNTFEWRFKSPDWVWSSSKIGELWTSSISARYNSQQCLYEYR